MLDCELMSLSSQIDVIVVFAVARVQAGMREPPVLSLIFSNPVPVKVGLMSFLISDAMAQGGGSADPGYMGLLFPILLIVVFYFLLIRPQTKRAKEHKAMVAALKKGDEVVTGGGVLGRITDVGENFIQLEVAEGVQLRVQKQSVATLMPKGTAKSDL